MKFLILALAFAFTACTYTNVTTTTVVVKVDSKKAGNWDNDQSNNSTEYSEYDEVPWSLLPGKSAEELHRVFKKKSDKDDSKSDTGYESKVKTKVEKEAYP